MLLGLGDCTFGQCPRISTVSESGFRKKIIQISCGSTVAAALTLRFQDNVNEDGDKECLEWGTGMYGERLSFRKKSHGHGAAPDATSASGSDFADFRAADASPLPMLIEKTSIRAIAFGAHFVVASMERGGCVSWGGGRSLSVLGRGGCNSCTFASLSSRAEHGSSAAAWVADPLGKGGIQVTALAAGDNHVLAVCADGNTRSWGQGDCGQLGVGPLKEGGPAVHRCVPAVVCLPRRCLPASSAASSHQGKAPHVMAVACGRNHSALLTKQGLVLTFGSGLYGQLGLGYADTMVWSPTIVEALEGTGSMSADGIFSGVSSVACGGWHTAAVSSTGDVYTWGWARFGALGPLSWSNTSTGTTKRETRGGKPVLEDETSNDSEIVSIPSLVDSIDLSESDRIDTVQCGARYTIVMSFERRVFVWGQVSPSVNPNEGVSRANVARQASTFASPRELIPEALVRDKLKHTGASRSAETNSHGESGADMQEQVAKSTEDLMHLGGEWRVTCTGCGPWYLVLGLENTRHSNARQM